MKPSAAMAGFIAVHIVATGALALVAQSSKSSMDWLPLLSEPIPVEASRLGAVPGASRLAILGHALISPTFVLGVASCAFAMTWFRMFARRNCIGDFMLLSMLSTAASGTLGLFGLVAPFGLLAPLFALATSFTLFVGLDDIRSGRLLLAQAVVLGTLPGFHVGTALVGIAVGALFTAGARFVGRVAVARSFLRMTQPFVLPRLESPTERSNSTLEALLRRKP